MKLEEYQRPTGVICFKNGVICGILPNQLLVTDTMLPLELLNILACPICKGELIQSGDGSALLCETCNREYPVIEGIPLLLPGQSTPNLRPKRSEP